MSEDLQIRANGKLLLAGEYFVLDGATSFAIPTQFGQTFDLSVIPDGPNKIYWQSIDNKGFSWFKSAFSSIDFSILNSTSATVALKLSQIFQTADQLRGTIPGGTIFIKSTLDFPRDWGLGSSSTLIYAMAKWLEVDPFKLLAETFGGSGYDIACAQSETPLLFTLKDNQPQWGSTSFSPSFQEQIGFVYLGNKMNSREGIHMYRQKGEAPISLIDNITQLAKAMTLVKDLVSFIHIIEQLEDLTSNWIQIKTLKKELFSDFDGGIKSLGAWGGDFLMVASNQGTPYMKSYFRQRGLDVFLKYTEMTLG